MKSPQFDELGLAPAVQSTVFACGYATPTEVQARTIPSVLRGRDVIATAQTGSGKTASFVLPMIHTLTANAAHNGNSRNNGSSRGCSRSNPRESFRNRDTQPDARKAGRNKPVPKAATPTALILAPTRELAIQIFQSTQTYGAGSRLRGACVYGGAPKPSQTRALESSPEILVATPGRLLDFIGERRIDLSLVEYLVLDEGDRMLDMGFMPDIRKIVGMTSASRQTVLYSATMPEEIQKLSREILTDPERIACSSGEVNVDGIDQAVMFVEQSDKTQLLVDLIETRRMYKAIVFTRTKHKASRLAKHLSKQRIDSAEIHGDRTQNQRNRALDAFRNGKVQVLVATDVAARGIDVDSITHVINYEMPSEAEMYVHRIGRTGRAGATGSAVSLCNREELGSLKAIERLIEKSITIDSDHQWHIDIRPRRQNGGNHGNGADGDNRGNRRNNGNRGNGGNRGSRGKRADGDNRGPGASRPRKGGARKQAFGKRNGEGRHGGVREAGQPRSAGRSGRRSPGRS